ncbi:GNAT family N-acetyltransferase [Anaerofustis stercorihominis]|uniref:GNAT family N-acetyltransferase n=1 Tax=Anaerofustis stercorihominis TaxID=214853 RepID=UPI00214CA555|nr:GNAT family N-acetyltransferase [Anaerofustis stercorihominis]MCR2033016.1 GNAT family N-acetyltransferase [Anaerofustis stercorihominis]
MLFVEVNSRGTGYEKKLIEYVINNLNVKYVDVNEQNPKTLEFYEHQGFKIFKIDEYDEQGNHIPILHLELK